MTTQKNHLYFGDNYDVLQRYLKDESVDLVYLDPPFNSRQDYNVLFAEKDGSQSSSQIRAFEDTWEWNIDAERSYEHIVERGGRVALRNKRKVQTVASMAVCISMTIDQGIQSKSSFQ